MQKIKCTPISSLAFQVRINELNIKLEDNVVHITSVEIAFSICNEITVVL